MNKKRIFNCVMLPTLLSLVSGSVMAHANIVAKDNLDVYSGRIYEEGSSAFLEINLGHGCHAEDGSSFPTRHVSAVFPNAEDMTGIAFTKDGAGTHYAGNAMYGIKPSVDSDWSSIQVIPGAVATHYSHGAMSGDTRAIHWLGGFVPDSMYENLQFKASFPTLEGCVSKLHVYVPVVQYCDAGLKNAWVKSPTVKFPAEEISMGYAPYFDVARNETKNPLPVNCNGVGETVEVYPNDADVDAYLPVSGVSSKAAGEDERDGNDNRAAATGWLALLAFAGLLLMRRKMRAV